MVDKITADQLADWIDTGAQFSLIDTRPADSFEAWHVPNAENIPYDPREGMGESQRDAVSRLVDGGPVVTICGKGLTSASFGFELEEQGYDSVSVVAGGMESWSTVYETAQIETNHDDLFVTQIQRRAKGCLGYVIGSMATEEAAVIDATRATEQFKIGAQDAGVTIEHVLDTHVHADHISGGPALAEDVDAPYYLGAGANERGVEFDYNALSDGDAVEIGETKIEALHTPGHTSEMVSYLVDDELLLTGDTLFVDSVGRTELQFGDEDASDGAAQLYDSLHDIILELPDETTVLPGHLTVTSDGRYENGSPGAPVTARLGELRDEVAILRCGKEEFIDRLTNDTPEKPSNYEEIIAINIGEQTVEDDSAATELEVGPNNCAA